MGNSAKGENVLYPSIYKNQFLCLYDAIMENFPNQKDILGITLNVLIVAISNKSNKKVVTDKVKDIACIKSSVEENININFKRNLVIEEDVQNFPIEFCNDDAFFTPIIDDDNLGDPNGLFNCVNSFMDTFANIRLSTNLLNYHPNQDKVSSLDNSLKNVLSVIYSDLCTKFGILSNPLTVLRILDLFYYIYNKSSMFDNKELSDSTDKMFNIVGEFLAERDFPYKNIISIDTLTKNHNGILVDSDENEILDFIVGVCDKLEENDRIKMKDLWNNKILI